MGNQFEPKKISFQKHDGKETQVNIIEETLMNKGAFGEISDAVVEINGRQKRFVIKKYMYDTEEIVEECTERAFRNYSLAKDAGLKVFPTFRLGEDKKSILMTTGFLEDQICIGSNNFLNIQDFNQTFIGKIENEDEFLKSFFAEGLQAAKKGIIINDDVPFFIISKNKPTKIDFVLGDLDNLRKASPTKTTGQINMRKIKSTLLEFNRKNIHPNFQKPFLEKVELYFMQALKNVDDSELK